MIKRKRHKKKKNKSHSLQISPERNICTPLLFDYNKKCSLCRDIKYLCDVTDQDQLRVDKIFKTYYSPHNVCKYHSDVFTKTFRVSLYSKHPYENESNIKILKYVLAKMVLNSPHWLVDILQKSFHDSLKWSVEFSDEVQTEHVRGNVFSINTDSLHDFAVYPLIYYVFYCITELSRDQLNELISMISMLDDGTLQNNLNVALEFSDLSQNIRVATKSVILAWIVLNEDRWDACSHFMIENNTYADVISSMNTFFGKEEEKTRRGYHIIMKLISNYIYKNSISLTWFTNIIRTNKDVCQKYPELIEPTLTSLHRYRKYYIDRKKRQCEIGDLLLECGFDMTQSIYLSEYQTYCRLDNLLNFTDRCQRRGGGFYSIQKFFSISM